MQEGFKLAYEEPFWSGLPTGGSWSLDVVRDGVELPSVPLHEKACALVGRVPVCDIVLENDTVSRQHAVLQQRSNGKLYVYDLGSTHGTFVVRRRVEPRTYVELEPGMHLQFGMSSRRFIVQGGPQKDEAGEAESEKTETKEAVEVVHALSKRQRKRLAEQSFEGSIEDAEKFVRQQEHAQRMNKERKKKKRREEKRKRRAEGGDEFDDMDDDEEVDSADLDDVDDDANEGEADPDKKVVGTARSNWDEYDDNDEDEFYDRTKRAKKEAKEGKLSASGKALSREEIINAKIELDLELRQLEAAMEKKAAEKNMPGDEEEDELDAYMAQVKRDEVGSELKKMQQRQKELQDENTRLDRLLKASSSLLDAAPAAKTSSLQERVAANMVKGFAVPEARKRPPAAKVALVEVDLSPEPQKKKAPTPIYAGGSGVAAALATAQKKAKKSNQDEADAVEKRRPQAQYVARDPDRDLEVEWKRPVGQSGDGKTSLNEKLGY